jgi:hypothetical protein
MNAPDAIEPRVRRDDHHAHARALIGFTLSHGGHS